MEYPCRLVIQLRPSALVYLWGLVVVLLEVAYMLKEAQELVLEGRCR